ncbi:hypothetical protein TREMEDRAFT_58530 [Tremella mesenterica DSM 1558]|uniref:uncharacterized protein n=1 Tax=Tremella mesenterica (strain ATCC 24925 / CBS 8224 / DSM 1558 / NBRC 9311 / NRRL Y-6157 / RJB 2259-6 / UBC 559-6) TaxID=578456 RepID=UPI0003F49371|nr:uncharacterized protein TREMEDRAFT_58530 [Tremella mesenterica DSM 1558]EIW72363.1 hypothetical protein TREMEDRAFT_58530 [Tremella mesenterica DSM 1558]
MTVDMSHVIDVPPPRFDFYQSPVSLTLAVYVKGRRAEDVKITYSSDSIAVEVLSGQAWQRFVLGPLFASINSEKTTHRVLQSKIEIQLAKVSEGIWPALIRSKSSGSSGQSSFPGPSIVTGPVPPPPATPFLARDEDVSASTSEKKAARNWDKLVDVELQEPESTDPATLLHELISQNAGGDAALQKLFSSIYANADDDTKRAMVKSFTESGGTTLSTDWNTIGKGKTPIRPPEGMEARPM